MKSTNKSKLVNHLKAGEYVSGETLSRMLGISRTAVWKYINELRGQGYLIDSLSRKGYLLKNSPDILSPEEISWGLSTSFCGKNIFYYDSVASTNDTAFELGKRGEPEGTLVIAEEQTSGKGRRGRVWHSPFGKGIWMSLLFYPRCLTPAQIAPFTAAAAAVTAFSLRRSTGAHVSVKWPNDLLVNQKKIGGMLAEIQGNQEQVEHLVFGIGINVNQTPEALNQVATPENASALSIATSLGYETKQSLRRAEICRLLLKDLEEGYLNFLKKGFSSFRESWLKYNVTCGKKVRIAAGPNQLEGWARDIDQQGALLLEDLNGYTHRLSYGEIMNE